MEAYNSSRGPAWPSSGCLHAEDSACRPPTVAESCDSPSRSGGSSLAGQSSKRSSHGLAETSAGNSGSPALPAFARTSVDSQETTETSRLNITESQPANVDGRVRAWLTNLLDGSWALKRTQAQAALPSLSRAELLAISGELDVLEASFRRELARAKADFAAHVPVRRPSGSEASLGAVTCAGPQLLGTGPGQVGSIHAAVSRTGLGIDARRSVEAGHGTGLGTGSMSRGFGPAGPQQQQPNTPSRPAPTPATGPVDSGLVADDGTGYGLPPRGRFSMQQECVSALFEAIKNYPQRPLPQPQQQPQQQQLVHSAGPQRMSGTAAPRASPAELMPPPPPPPQLHCAPRLQAPPPSQVPQGAGAAGSRGLDVVAAAAAAAAVAATLHRNAALRQAPLPPRPEPVRAASGAGGTMTPHAAERVGAPTAVGRRPVQLSDASIPVPPLRPSSAPLHLARVPGPSAAHVTATTSLPSPRAAARAQHGGHQQLQQAVSGTKRSAADVACWGIKAAPQPQLPQPSQPLPLQVQQSPQPPRLQPPQPQQPQQPRSPQESDSSAALAAVMMLLRHAQQQQQQEPSHKRQRLLQ